LNPETADWISARLNLDWLQNSPIRQIISTCLQAHATRSWRGVPALLNAQEDETSRVLITQTVSDQRGIPDPEKTLKGDHSKKGVLQALRDDFIDRQLAALTRRLIQPGITDSEMIEVEREKAKLRQQKGQPV